MDDPKTFIAQYEDWSYRNLLVLRDETAAAMKKYEDNAIDDEAWSRSPNPDEIYQMQLLYMVEIYKLINEKFQMTGRGKRHEKSKTEMPVFKFEYGSFIGKSDVFMVFKDGDNYRLTGSDEQYNDEIYSIAISQRDLDKLSSLLEPVKGWKKHYEAKESDFSGMMWSVFFHGDGSLIESSGYEAAPEGFDEFKDQLVDAIEAVKKNRIQHPLI